MPVPVTNALKYTFAFALSDDEGWTETYYRLGSSIDDVAVTAARDLAIKRSFPLVPACKIKFCRISASPSTRASRLVKFLNQRGDPTPPTTRDVGAVTTELAMYSSLGHRRDMQFHGLADDRHTYDVNGDQTQTISAGLKAFLDYLVANQWQMRVESKTAQDPTNSPISSIALVGGLVNFLSPAVVAPGQQFIVSGFKGWKANQFRGTWTCAAFTAGAPNNTIGCYTRKLIDPNYFVAKWGNIRVITSSFFNFEPMTAFDQTGAVYSTRRIGRPPSVRRGRRSTIR